MNSLTELYVYQLIAIQDYSSVLPKLLYKALFKYE